MIFSVIAQWIGVLCLVQWGFWLCCKLKMPAGFAPLAGLCFAVVIMQLAGSVNLLWPGAQLLFIGGVLTLAHRKRQELAACLLRPGVLAFFAGVAVLQIACAIRAPRFQTWDEFSHWGIFFKSVFYDHSFALWQATRSLAHPAYPQGLPGLYALFALFLPKTYAERDVFFVVALPLLAAGAALFELTMPATPRKLPRIVLTACACLAVPVLFRVFTPDTPYTTAYMDAPVGALFAGALLLTLLPLDTCAPPALLRRGLASGLLCAALTTVKEIGTVYALCILGIWVLQCLLAFAANQKNIGAKFSKSVFLPVLAAAGPFAAMSAEWKILLAVLHRNDDQFSSMGFGYFMQCLQEARGGIDQYFYDVWGVYYAKFRTSVLLFGFSTFKLGVICVVLSLVLAAGLALVKHRRAALTPLCMCLYWPCYQFVLFYVYIGGMSPYEAMRVASYERYACCFFIGWFAVLLGGLFMVTRALFAQKAAVFAQIGLAALLALYGVFGLVRLSAVTSLPHEDWRDTQLANAAAITGKIEADGGSREDAIWILSADEDTSYQNMWYYQYELSPLLVAVETQTGEAGVDLGYNIGQQDVKYIVLLGATKDFTAQYAALANDALAAAQGGNTAVYAVQAGNSATEPTLTLLR